MNVNVPKIKKPVAVPMKMGRIVKRMKNGARAMKKGRTEEKQGPENVIFYNSKEINFPYGGPGQGGRGGAGSGAGVTEEIRLKGSGIKIELPSLASSVLGSPISGEEKEMLRSIRMTYPLIPHEPKTMERVFAYAKIYWDEKRNCMVYLVVEPHLTPQDQRLIEQIKREMEEMLDIDFFKLGEVKAKELVVQEIGKILLSKSIDRRKMEIIQYYVQRDIIGLGKIEPLMKDANIEDISCDGHGIPIYVYHRNTLLGSIITNVMFSDSDELDSFTMKLAQKGGKSVSVADPLVDGSLPDGSRVQATLGTDIARRGSNFTIRKFTDKPLTPVHMIEYGTVDSTVMAYLWLAIEHRKSILISGGTATGKTSFLNALSLFIKPALKIVSIEDTPELRLPHPHWIPEVARTPISTEGKIGEVSLFDLLRESLRQRPDYIIVGDVRGKEAFVLFQQIATGHSGLATIHAASLPQLLDRLTTPPISLPPTLIENIDIIVFLTQVKIGDKYLRRANEVMEVKGTAGEKPITESVFKWKPVADVFEHVGSSVVMESISKMAGITEKSMMDEIRARKSVLDWMHEKKMFDYRDVAKVINGYYSDPERILNLVESI
jgi:flagellar protein FlaI